MLKEEIVVSEKIDEFFFVEECISSYNFMVIRRALIGSVQHKK